MTTDPWENFVVLVGGASAALTGLLFVSVSLNLDRIGANALLRAAAAQSASRVMAIRQRFSPAFRETYAIFRAKPALT